MRIPQEYKHRVWDAYMDEDGAWIVLTESWKCPNWYEGEKVIHEDTMKECLKVLKATRFTLA